MKDRRLTKLSKKLSHYHVYFKDSGVLAVCEDSASMPFCFVTTVGEEPNLFLSVAVDYPNSVVVAEVTLVVASVASVSLTDPFYITSDGTILFNDDAYKQHDIDNLLDSTNNRTLNDLPTPNNYVN